MAAAGGGLHPPRSGPGTRYKILPSYKNASLVQLINKTNSSWYEVTAQDGKRGYMSTSHLAFDHQESSAQIADAGITDAKIVELSANRITTGVLSVERLIIRGSEQSLIYAINNMGELVSAEVDTIDGYVLTERTITVDKTAFGCLFFIFSRFSVKNAKQK